MVIFPQTCVQKIHKRSYKKFTNDLVNAYDSDLVNACDSEFVDTYTNDLVNFLYERL